MSHHVAAVSWVHGDPTLRRTTRAAASPVLTLVVRRDEDIAFIEFPSGEPMDNVLRLIQDAERVYGLAFDLLDADMCEYPKGGVRVHGMFVDDIIGEEIAGGIGSCERTLCA